MYLSKFQMGAVGQDGLIDLMQTGAAEGQQNLMQSGQKGYKKISSLPSSSFFAATFLMHSSLSQALSFVF